MRELLPLLKGSGGRSSSPSGSASSVFGRWTAAVVAPLWTSHSQVANYDGGTRLRNHCLVRSREARVEAPAGGNACPGAAAGQRGPQQAQTCQLPLRNRATDRAAEAKACDHPAGRGRGRDCSTDFEFERFEERRRFELAAGLRHTRRGYGNLSLRLLGVGIRARTRCSGHGSCCGSSPRLAAPAASLCACSRAPRPADHVGEPLVIQSSDPALHSGPRAPGPAALEWVCLAGAQSPDLIRLRASRRTWGPQAPFREGPARSIPTPQPVPRRLPVSAGARPQARCRWQLQFPENFYMCAHTRTRAGVCRRVSSPQSLTRSRSRCQSAADRPSGRAAGWTSRPGSPALLGGHNPRDRAVVRPHVLDGKKCRGRTLARATNRARQPAARAERIPATSPGVADPCRPLPALRSLSGRRAHRLGSRMQTCPWTPCSPATRS